MSKKLQYAPNASQAPPKRRNIGRCFGCGSPITEYQQTLNALKQKWHKECFVCVNCGSPFGDSGFNSWHNQPFCSNECIQSFHKKRNKGKDHCGGCGRFNHEDDPLIFGGQSWHYECFVCYGCNKELEGNVIERQGIPYCSNECATDSVCNGCGLPLGNRVIKVSGKSFHEECYKSNPTPYNTSSNNPEAKPCCCPLCCSIS